MSTVTITIGTVRLTRVGYIDVEVPSEIAGLTPEQVQAVEWGPPLWATGHQLRAGAAAWVIEDGDARIVVDPAQAADDLLWGPDNAAAQQEAFATLLADAGFARESITHALSTHHEGIGMLAWRNDDGTWSPFFPNAPLLIPRLDLDAVDAGVHPSPASAALPGLRDAGIIRTVEDHEPITAHVTLDVTAGHTPGHSVVRIESEGETAVMLGHLAVSPLHLVTGECPQQHPDPERALTELTSLRDEGSLLIGPLWPEPGAGRWDGQRFVAVGTSP